MAEGGHTGVRALLEGRLPAAGRAAAEAHLAGCAECREEHALLRDAFSVLRPVPAREPRLGFAAQVALEARDRAGHPVGAPWWRIAFGGVALAGLAAVALVVALPHRPARVAAVATAEPAADGVAGAAPADVMLAQRLDLYEDLGVVQHEDALEELDLVSVLHELQPEGKP